MISLNKNIIKFSLVLLLSVIGCGRKAEKQIESSSVSGKTDVVTGGGTMTVAKGSSIKVQYEGRLETGDIFDKSKEDQPLEFTVGSGQIIPGFDRAVEGMKAGEDKEITIEPEDAYGPRNEEMVREVPRSNMPEGVDLKVGMVLSSQSPTGQSMPVVVTEFDDETVKIDFNHPLAGKKLIFKITVVEIN